MGRWMILDGGLRVWRVGCLRFAQIRSAFVAVQVTKSWRWLEHLRMARGVVVEVHGCVS
jgi:hypothetical protein